MGRTPSVLKKPIEPQVPAPMTTTKTLIMKNLLRPTGLFVLLFTLNPAAAAEPTMAERVGALKASMASSQTALRHYEWIETTVVSLKGEEKANNQERCYYAAEGGVTKVPLTAAPPAEKKGGLRGKIVEKKKGEMTDYMKQAVAMVKSYVPPSPALIQAAKDAGKVSMDVIEPGKRLRMNFRDYLKSGDTLSLEMDLTSNRLLGLAVKTYLEDVKDAVNLDAKFAQLADGTTYSSAITLAAPAKELNVTVGNSGYRKVAN